MVTPTVFPVDKITLADKKSLLHKCINSLVSCKLSHDCYYWFFFWALTGPYPTLRFGCACGRGGNQKRYGADAQSPLPKDISQKLNKKEIKQVQKIVRSILYYARAVDMTVLMALSTIASEQTKGTERTLEKAYQVLDYLATHPNAVVRFRVSDMVLNIHSDASYLSEPKARSRACGHFFMGALPKDGKPIKLNGAFHTLCSI
jgi:hypothetical protein